VLEEDSTVLTGRILGEDDFELLRVGRREIENAIPSNNEPARRGESVRLHEDMATTRGVCRVEVGVQRGREVGRLAGVAGRKIESDEPVGAHVCAIVNDAVEPEGE